MRNKVNIVATEGFGVMLTTYLILLLVETIQAGWVSYFFQLNYLLAGVTVAGIMMVLTGEERIRNQETENRVRRRDWVYIAIMSVVGAGLVGYKTLELGKIAWVIAGITGVIIFLLSYLVLTED